MFMWKFLGLSFAAFILALIAISTLTTFGILATLASALGLSGLLMSYYLFALYCRFDHKVITS